MEPEKRPHFRPTLTPLDWLIEIGAFATMMFCIAYTLMSFRTLPARIPTHFDAAGTVDGWGGKSILFLMPTMGVGFYLLLTLLQFFPWVYNMPVEITERNAPRVYRVSVRMMRLVKFELIAMLSFVGWVMARVALKQASGMGMWPLFVFLAALTATVIWGMAAILHGRDE